jgi:hypothetical protein
VYRFDSGQISRASIQFNIDTSLIPYHVAFGDGRLFVLVQDVAEVGKTNLLIFDNVLSGGDIYPSLKLDTDGKFYDAYFDGVHLWTAEGQDSAGKSIFRGFHSSGEQIASYGRDFGGRADEITGVRTFKNLLVAIFGRGGFEPEEGSRGVGLSFFSITNAKNPSLSALTEGGLIFGATDVAISVLETQEYAIIAADRTHGQLRVFKISAF